MKMRLHVGSMSVPQARRLMCDLVIGIKDYAVPHDENEEEKNSLVDARINALGFANVGKPFAKIPDSEVGDAEREKSIRDCVCGTGRFSSSCRGCQLY